MANSLAHASLDVGSVIADTYTIDALIGRGGMGAVFVASHNRLPGTRVAVKVLHPDIRDDEVLARFKREAEIASKLGHPNIVQVRDINALADGTPYLLMELLEGETLAQRLARGPLAIDHAMSIVRQVGSALAAAHREGIVHRDLKPQNIFLVATEVDGRSVEVAKVLDFGISKIRGSQTVKTQDSALLGTPQYMAPEQAKGDHAAVDERTDVFALGTIVYEMLVGQPAFTGASIPEVVFKVVYEEPVPIEVALPTVPAHVAAAVARAMAKARDARFASVGELVEALTGMPLPVSRGPSSMPPPIAGGTASEARRRDVSGDAFARTMGSDPGRAAPPVSADAPTVASQHDRVTIAKPARRRGPLVIALAIGCVAAGGLAVYFALRTGDRDPRPAPASEHVAATRSAAIAVDAGTTRASALAVDAAVVAVVAPPADAATPPADAAAAPTDASVATRVHPPAPHHDGTPAKLQPAALPGDEHVTAQLAEAERALAAGSTLAERLANGVISSPVASELQLAQAHAIHGIIECHVRANQEGANIDYRAMPARAAASRRRLANACAREHIDVHD